MRKLIFVIVLLGFSILFTEWFSKDAGAIPAFARKYKTACTTCHATFPRLTALGEAFRLNGFKMPDGDELYIKDAPVSLGAQGYKQVFPDSVWPSDIPGMPPIAIRVIGDAEWDIGHEASQKDNSYRMEFPHALAILSAGSLGENMSFFTEVEFEHPDQETTDVNGNTIVGPEELGFSSWLMWEDLFVKNVLNFKVGNIGSREIALPNARDEDRITKTHYLYNDKFTDGLGGPGFEVNGFGKHWQYAVGWVKPQNEFVDGSPYVQVSLKFGGLGYDGSGGTTEEGGLKTNPSGYWRDDSIRLGGFYYRGDNNIDFYGIDTRLNHQDLSFAVGYTKKNNRTASDLNQQISFAELEYFLLPWVQPFVRYEAFSDDVPDQDQSIYTVGTVLLVRANVKVNVEGMFYSKNDPAVKATPARDKNVDDRVFVRLDYVY